MKTLTFDWADRAIIDFLIYVRTRYSVPMDGIVSPYVEREVNGTMDVEFVNHIPYRYHFTFDNDRDATLFILRWL